MVCCLVAHQAITKTNIDILLSPNLQPRIFSGTYLDINNVVHLNLYFQPGG